MLFFSLSLFLRDLLEGHIKEDLRKQCKGQVPKKLDYQPPEARGQPLKKLSSADSLADASSPHVFLL